MNDFNLNTNPKITTGFKVPDGYFDSFSTKVLEQLPKQESKFVGVFSFRKTWYYAAAAVVVLGLSISLYHQYTLKQDLADVTVLEDYLANNASITEDEILNSLDKEDLEKMKIDFKLQDKDIEEVLENNSNLEQYILD
ncbi:hypothetical protein EZL74_10690 [Flavobacterium silvisoli]|uniref:Uncharacterized protein n=1 Tax=Flavobacterium silvisoli TaxID=2529433 RepID=A0A4Q9YSQ9_9FLAO|nr:hypothetical protein [Flavobacterium silvisoli]TBX66641.1 hypothetical protein EZL74_10690 [Flavobacterium silvisoli]